MFQSVVIIALIFSRKYDNRSGILSPVSAVFLSWIFQLVWGWNLLGDQEKTFPFSALIFLFRNSICVIIAHSGNLQSTVILMSLFTRCNRRSFIWVAEYFHKEVATHNNCIGWKRGRIHSTRRSIYRIVIHCFKKRGFVCSSGWFCIILKWLLECDGSLGHLITAVRVFFRIVIICFENWDRARGYTDTI